MSFHRRTAEAARGRWRGILMELGLPEAALKNRHGPCPICTSTDNFRFDDKEGKGSWICTCGAGDGMNLAMAYTGKTFAEIASKIDGMVGNIKVDAPRPQMTEQTRLDALRDVYRATQRAAPGDLVHLYLEARNVGEVMYPDALRFAPALRDGDGGCRPCMVSMIENPAGEAVSMHRTFLKPDGTGKAEMATPRRLMPGELPDGACVRLGEYTPGGPLGVAEGIETAMAASIMFEMPVWAAINTSMLKRWLPPESCDEVAIFGDNDPKFGGQAAAYALGHKLSVKGIKTTIHIPSDVGTDWCDIHEMRFTK